ncbi:MAG: TonB-dependent receptor [candidate division KSB1 bacterium]|nr:TonB-dependent receptor [candidate division KSB1 bacterium]
MMLKRNMLFLFIVILAMQVFAEKKEKVSYAMLNDLYGKNIPHNFLNKITFHANKTPLEEVLSDFSTMAGLNLNYNRAEIPLDQPITLHMEEVYAVEALFAALSMTNTRLFISDGGQLVIEAGSPGGSKSSAAREKKKTGTIRGKVIEKATDSPLPGANVILEGTSIGAATDLKGEYLISNVPEGNYTLVVKYIGYNDGKNTIFVNHDKTVQYDAEMERATVKGEEITITAQAEGQLAAINQQLASRTIKNVVAADRIQEIPDANAAESIGRLPGISIVRSGGEGQKVSIRGMSPRYNVMMVNGVRLRSTDRDDRSVDLNMISSNMLSGIEVTKALTANMDADAVGGTVNLRLTGAEPGWHGNITMQGGYGSIQNNYDNYKTNASLSNRFFDDKLGVVLTANVERIDRSSDMLRAGYGVNEESDKDEKGLSNIDLSSVKLRDVATKRKRHGAGLILDYRLPAGELLYHGFASQLSEHQMDMSNSLPVDMERLTGYMIERNIKNTVMSQALQGNYRIGQIKLDFSLHQSISRQNRPGDLQLNIGSPDEPSIFSALSIEDAFKATPNRYLNSVTVNNNVLAVSELFNMKRDVVESERMAQGNLAIPYQFSKNVTGKLRLGFKYGNTERDNDETHDVVAFETGSNGKEFTRMLPELWPELGVEAKDYEQNLRAGLFENPGYDEGNFLSGNESVNSLFWTGSFGKLNHLDQLAKDEDVYVIDGLASTARRYDMTETLTAFYISTALNLGRRITFQPGVRYESFETDYLAYKGIQTGWRVWNYFSEPVTSTRKSDQWFPQIHLRVKPAEWFDIRLASTRSLIRPDYRAYSPYSYYAGVSAQPSLQIGNINIKPSISNNLDLYVSVYNNAIGLFTAGGFYKEIDNIITPLRFHSSDNDDIDNQYELGGIMTVIDTWINVNEKPTIVRGFELDWQTNFWYLPSIFKGMVLNVNYTRLFSETIYPYDVFYKDPDNIFARGVFVDSSRTGRMPHQPNDVLNLTVGYDLGGLSARLSFLFQGQMLGKGGSGETAGNIRGSSSRMGNVAIGIRPELDPYTDDYYRWDLTVQQKLPWPGFQLYFNANNLSNSIDQQSLSILGKLKAREYYGRTFDLGFRYRF